MSGPDLDRFVEIYNDSARFPLIVDVARELGISDRHVRRLVVGTRLRSARGEAGSVELIERRATKTDLRQAETGELGFAPVLPGYALKQTSTQFDASGAVEREWIQQTKAPGEKFEVPAGHTIKGVSALIDAKGRELAKWVKTREGGSPDDLVSIIKGAFDDYTPAATSTPAPHQVSDEMLTLIPCADWHVGMYAWGLETGINWDLKIAEDVIGRGVEEAIERSPRCGKAIVLGGGDLLHADNGENRTARSGHTLDVDGRYEKVIAVASRLMVRTVDAALRRHGEVIVRILKGNHDEHAATAIAYFMKAWYRNEPRVTVDVDPSLFFWHRFGSVMLGATHGHMVKIKDMASIMAHRRAPDWGVTRFRYVHGFHLHHSSKLVSEGEGVISEIHQTPTPQDAWHFGSGFLSGRSIQSITYHQRYGEISRARVAILDDVCSAA